MMYYLGFAAPPTKEPHNATSVECASKVATSFSYSDNATTKFNAFAYDHRTKMCILGNISPFSTNFDTAGKFQRTDITTGSLYMIQDCLPKRK